MSKITTFLTYNNQAEEAVRHYTAIFPNSEIKHISYYNEGGHLPEGTAMSVVFILNGQTYYALNAGSGFGFSEGMSLLVTCETQTEIDAYWQKLTEGGQPGPCGWLKDKFGVSWQVVPEGLDKLLQHSDPAKAKRVMAAMMKMSKLDVAALEAA
ncbi:3-demethylubiquinone-9 3-methyltransferase [Fibrella aestuarina BUZ 2]|uniref:3-demethylubiquinone-9 3-methyltransferase n=1 Tax=Fibrella aestuarina BUZ 2 TaxID=1166018 RepID=I0K5L2_9BACT|nr:VOC family protein [Fibrella aestuarina]CCG99415.1 3-demethylubiquinone-9 3-methyltransferase [Fibrella aestuarina BUZ 2]